MSRKNPTYEEYYVYLILKDILNIKDIVLSDRPDIRYINKNEGIEVTSSLLEDEHKVESYFNDLKKPNKVAKLPASYHVDSGIVCGDTRSIEDNKNFIKKAKEEIVKKICKKKDYSIETRELFITIDLISSTQNEMTEVCRKIQEEFDSFFDKIYFEIRNEGIVLEICRDTQNVYDINKQQFRIAENAYSLYQKEKGDI